MNTVHETNRLSEIVAAQGPGSMPLIHTQNNVDRPLVAVVATPIEHRNAWRETVFPRADIHLVVTTTGSQCIEAMHSQQPDVLVLELKRNWGCPEMVLKARNVIHQFRQIPVVLISRAGVCSEVYPLSSFVVQRFYSRMPDFDELANSLLRLFEIQIKGNRA